MKWPYYKYEQKRIREQITQLTGKRFLTGYTNDEEAYQALMTNGVTFAQQLSCPRVRQAFPPHFKPVFYKNALEMTDFSNINATNTG